MRQAGKILRETRELLINAVAPGVSTSQLNKIAYDYILASDAQPSFLGYEGFPGSICTSVNDCVIHGIPRVSEVLKKGDIISLDIGVCYKGYHADSAVTVGVSTITKGAQMLLDVTQESLNCGIKAAISGNYVSDISKAVEDYIKPFNYGIVREFTGHGIGKDIHEDPSIPNYVSKSKGALLKSGMVICIEPMVNQGTHKVKVLSDNWKVVTIDHKLSAHFEHMILIKGDTPEILT